jgi:hypothetical protein
MALDILKEKGVPLERQKFTWRELAGKPYSKLNDDAFSRVRVILMNGIELGSIRFSHACARMSKELREDLARVRRIDHHQQTMVNWLNPADQSQIETTLAYEQVAIEVTASVAQAEPDPYMAQVYRFGLLEDFDHLYRFAALADRVEGKDPNIILQSYTDIRPGRPTSVEHRDPLDDLREHYERNTAQPLTKIFALTILHGEHQTRDYYMNVGPMYADPIGRALYAEIASVEEQHVTQYESIVDPKETWLEKWLLHEAAEAYNYWSCAQQESNRRLRALWERFLDYELGQLHFVGELLKRHEDRDPAELLPASLPDPIRYESHRDFVRQVLMQEVDLRADGTRFIHARDESAEAISARYRAQLNSEGAPSDQIAAGYRFHPGTELAALRTGEPLEGRNLQ